MPTGLLVSPASLRRFAALHVYDNVRERRLPAELRDKNPTDTPCGSVSTASGPTGSAAIQLTAGSLLPTRFASLIRTQPIQGLLDRLTRFVSGHRAAPTAYVLVDWLFIRLLGLIYLVAFASLAVQITGLIGSHGILPAGDY